MLFLERSIKLFSVKGFCEVNFLAINAISFVKEVANELVFLPENQGVKTLKGFRAERSDLDFLAN